MQHKIVNMLDPQSHHNPQPQRSSSGTLNMIPPWNIHTVKQSMPRSCSNGCPLSWFTPSKFFQLGPSTIARNTVSSRAGEASKITGSGYRSGLGGWLLTIDCIVYSDIVNIFKSSYLHSILSIAIIETPECQHCIVRQWAAFWHEGMENSQL